MTEFNYRKDSKEQMPYEHYMELFGFLYTEEQIAEIEAGCANCKESYE